MNSSKTYIIGCNEEVPRQQRRHPQYVKNKVCHVVFVLRFQRLKQGFLLLATLHFVPYPACYLYGVIVFALRIRSFKQGPPVHVHRIESKTPYLNKTSDLPTSQTENK